MQDDRPQRMNKAAAGCIAVGLLGFATYGVVTGDLSSRRHPGLDRAHEPLFFWTYVGLFAAVGVYMALVALGIVELKAAQPRDYALKVRHDFAQRMTFLALLTSGGSAYAWWSERSLVNPSVMNEIMGWIAVGSLGLAAWSPVLPPGPLRSVLRIAGAVAVLVAALAIYRLAR